jgi:hypothetical protein
MAAPATATHTQPTRSTTPYLSTWWALVLPYCRRHEPARPGRRDSLGSGRRSPALQDRRAAHPQRGRGKPSARVAGAAPHSRLAHERHAAGVLARVSGEAFASEQRGVWLVAAGLGFAPARSRLTSSSSRWCFPVGGADRSLSARSAGPPSHLRAAYAARCARGPDPACLAPADTLG